jgi:GntR family transcriptional regulator
MGQRGEQPETIAASGLGFSIDRTADVPIGIQLVWALRSRISAGDLTPGQRLPGLRDLADSTGVNVNTVRAVYQRLEQDGLIESQHGSGTFVAPSRGDSSGATAIAVSAARKAREAGVDPRDVAAALYVSAGPVRAARPVAAGQRSLLRAQIAALERALAQIEAEYPSLAPSATARRASGPALLSADELEQTRAQLVRRLASMQAAIDDLTSEPTESVHEEQPAPSLKGKGATRARRAKPRARPAPAGA